MVSKGKLVISDPHFLTSSKMHQLGMHQVDIAPDFAQVRVRDVWLLPEVRVGSVLKKQGQEDTEPKMNEILTFDRHDLHFYFWSRLNQADGKFQSLKY